VALTPNLLAPAHNKIRLGSNYEPFATINNMPETDPPIAPNGATLTLRVEQPAS
jgi:hypothetical protein